MQDLDALKQELAADPLARGYAGMTDEQRLASLRAVDVPVKRSIHSAALLAWSGAGGRRRKLTALANGIGDLLGLTTDQTNNLRNIAEVALVMLNRDGTELDLNLPDRVAMVDALTNAYCFSVEDKDALYALANGFVSRESQLPCGELHLAGVSASRT